MFCDCVCVRVLLVCYACKNFFMSWKNRAVHGVPGGHPWLYGVRAWHLRGVVDGKKMSIDTPLKIGMPEEQRGCARRADVQKIG